VCASGFQWTLLDERSTGEVVVEDSLAISFENRFGRHGGVGSGEICGLVIVMAVVD
jgi:hypothetical protein